MIDQIKKSGFSINEFSKVTNIAVSRLNELIVGSNEPTMSEVRKIAKALKVPTDFLVTKPRKYEEISVLFRQGLKTESDKIKADKISYIIGNTFSLLNDYQYNSFHEFFPPFENTFTNARILATKFRQIYYNGDFFIPLLNLPTLVSEELKCILFIIDLGSGTDGASAIIDKIPFIFISPRFQPRMLFTLAHELAHILSHHNSESNFAKIDKEVNGVKRNKYNDEGFANAFASELLMPEEGVGATLKTIRKGLGVTGPIGDVELIYLSRIYGVSFDVAAKRCEDLKLLPVGGAISLSDNLKKLHGSAEKRAKELDIPDRPEVVFPKIPSSLVNSAINKINSGEISIGQVSEILSVSISDIMNHNLKG